MFDKIEYTLLIENYMTKDEYRQLIKIYMDMYDISYINAKNKICLEQMKRFEKDFDTTYEKACIQKYNDINYNIFIV